MRDVHRYQITGKLYCHVSINDCYSIVGFDGIAGTSLLASPSQGCEAIYPTTKKLDNTEKMQTGCFVCAWPTYLWKSCSEASGENRAARRMSFQARQCEQWWDTLMESKGQCCNSQLSLSQIHRLGKCFCQKLFGKARHFLASGAPRIWGLFKHFVFITVKYCIHSIIWAWKLPIISIICSFGLLCQELEF